MFFPNIFWREIGSPWQRHAEFFLYENLANCFVEWVFHRYILHSKTRIGYPHRMHHAATPVSRYAIIDAFQEKFSHFPNWALPAFFGFYFPFILIMKLTLPAGPYFLDILGAVVFSYLGYEIKHAHHHRLYGGWWQKWVEMKGPLGRLGGKCHIGHFVHHENWRLNNNVFGFFGFPLADWLFGTLDLARKILPGGGLEKFPGYKAPKSVWFIRVLDQGLDI
ncbi:MAG: hypothetical protein Q8Q46_02415 [Candidatus Giovannonibacteria bacterium]|nr:hypothetical protein [Candidatus Giovannonibacteria bacterium]